MISLMPVDADVLFAGSASPTEFGASLVVLRMAEIPLIHAVTSRQVIVEAERNLAKKMPAALPAFQITSLDIPMSPSCGLGHLYLKCGICCRECGEWLIFPETSAGLVAMR